MGLFNLFGKQKPQHTNSVGEDLDHLTSEGELPFGWMAHNKEIVKQMNDERSAFRYAIDSAEAPVQKYEAMKSYFKYIEDGKKYYYSINECAGKYFEEYIYDTPETDMIKERFETLKKQLNKG